MRIIGGILRTLIVITILGSIASVIAAFYARGRLTSKGAPGDDELDLVAIYEALDSRSSAPAFRRGSYTAWYGGGTLDLRGATLDPAGATLTVRALFGGFRLVIPATWRVELSTVGIFGGIGDGRKADMIDLEGPVLRIDGFAIFGGVGIVSEAPDIDDAVADSLLLETQAFDAALIPA